MTHHPLPVNQRQQRHWDRAPVKAVRDADAAALAGCCRRGLSAEDILQYMRVFREIRSREASGKDTMSLLYRFELLGDDVAVAAYIEALASLRPVDWAL